ncbi:sigma-70 family RNA polymerase sigma factor [Gorillibacterium sp. sgz5001074]|uniref:sigma-70 family RNA polymerase sigma factor n=1 Tax=Gorillibacterium sp. sgz5001074 TaxID=3446695 RepID=UPI003F6744B9
MDAAAWVRAAQQGDDRAFLQLMDSCKERLYRIALAYLRSEAEALEAVQETTCRAYQNIRKLKQPDYWNTWVVRILLNACADEHRRRKRTAPHQAEPAAAFDDRSNSRLDLAVAVDSLPREQKEIVVLKYYQQFTLSEIAGLLECPEGTVKTRLHKALCTLRDISRREDWCHD